MAKLSFNEQAYFEKLFDMSSGYVLDFSNNSFSHDQTGGKIRAVSPGLGIKKTKAFSWSGTNAMWRSSPGVSSFFFN